MTKQLLSIPDEPNKSVIQAMRNDIIDLALTIGLHAKSTSNGYITIYKNHIYCGLIYYAGAFQLLYHFINNVHWKTAEVDIANPNWLDEVKTHLLNMGM